jgi:hypothetical protein
MIETCNNDFGQEPHMIVGVVGSEAAKFTSETEAQAKHLIRTLLYKPDVTGFSSGHCHLGGIDIWCEEIGIELSLKPFIFAPKSQNWTFGYKPRNELIAQTSNEVHCITVKELPANYKGIRFPLCYHCGTTDHVKSGGCWTMKYAQRIGKPGYLHIIQENPEASALVGFNSKLTTGEKR